MWQMSNIKNIKIDKLEGYDNYSLSFECDYEDGFVGDKRTLLIEVPNAVLSFSQEDKKVFRFNFLGMLGYKNASDVEEPFVTRTTVI